MEFVAKLIRNNDKMAEFMTISIHKEIFTIIQKSLLYDLSKLNE